MLVNMGEELRSLGEFGLIRRLREIVPAAAGVDVGIGDDAAVVRLEGAALLTVDMLVENVHFDLTLSAPEDLGFKALACSASDVAAMGGRPRYAVAAFGAPAETPLKIVEGIVEGLGAAASEFDIAWVGGDTVVAPVVTISITVAGETGPSGPVLRSGALAGDLLCVTGATGAAAAGLALMRRAANDRGAAAILDRHAHLARAHRRGRARIREGMAAAETMAHAMIDVSDGVGKDAAHVAENSGLGLRVFASNVPRAPGVDEAAAALGSSAERLAVAGGDDYELLIAIHPHDVALLRDAVAPTPLTVIGEFRDGDEREVEWSDGSREPAERAGWEHLA